MNKFFVAVTAAGLSLTACDFDSQLAPRVALDVVIEGTTVTRALTDLDYEVDLTRCRVALETVEFTTDGEQHAQLRPSMGLDAVQELLLPTAYAHPGHYGGGEIVGELVGRQVFDWRDSAVLGQADLTEALYTGANFTFARAQMSDGLTEDDPLIGHTFDIAGIARRGESTVEFEVQLDQDLDRRVVGLPFELDVDASTSASLGLALFPDDPYEEDTVFDGLDFFALDEDGDGKVVIEPGSEAYNRLRRQLQKHDFYGVVVR